MLIVAVHFGPHTAELTDRIPIGVSTAAYPAIISLREFRFSQAEKYGGYVSVQYGSMELAPNAFTATNPELSSWPPPETLDQVTIQWIPDDGSSPFYLPSNFVAQLESASAGKLVYQLRPAITYDNTVLDQHYTGTVVNCFAAACATLGLTLNYLWAAYPSPSVDWVATGDNLLIDNLSNLAKFYNHRFFIDGSTLYLIGDQIPAIADINITSSDAQSIEYSWGNRCREITTDYIVSSVNDITIDVVETGAMGTYAVISELQIAKSAGGIMAFPSAVAAPVYDPSNPPWHMIDGNVGTLFSGPNPGSLISFAVSTGGICEYAITAHATLYANTPTKWKLSAKNPATGISSHVAVVSSEDWTAGEVRKFQVPDAITMTAAYANPDGGDGIMHIAPSCHTVYSDMVSALHHIATELLADNARIIMPIRQIKPGQQLNLDDTTTVAGETIRFEMLARDITYDFTKGLVVVEGARSPI